MTLKNYGMVGKYHYRRLCHGMGRASLDSYPYPDRAGNWCLVALEFFILALP